MTASLILSQIMSGLVRGMMLFLVASGLTLIFSVTNVLNFAHAAFWLLGAYLTWTFWSVLFVHFPNLSLWVSIIMAAIAMAGIGWIIEVVVIRRVYGRHVTEQLLLTYGLAFIIGDLQKLVWGVEDRVVVRPSLLSGNVRILDTVFPTYYLLYISIAVFIALSLYWLLHRTRFGRIVRASVFSREMVSALGIPIPKIYTAVFGLASLIAGLAGGMQSPISAISLGMDASIIAECFCVLVIGGFGSILGAFVGSLIVGLVYSLAILIIPKMSLIIIYFVVAIVLITRPWGLFGSPMRS